MNFKYTYTLFPLLMILAGTSWMRAQDMVPVVERCKALDQTSPIHNVWVDEDNIKWVANQNGLHKVLALDLVQKVSIPAGTTHLLTLRGGNAQIEWNTTQMSSLLKNAVISSASYDAKTKSLWIGTQDRGAFQVSLEPLKIIQQFNTDNKRLTSNQINDIFIATNGTVWIATNDGMLTGRDDKWSLQERYLNFVGVDAWGSNMWILGDDFLWQVDARGKWSPIAIEPRNIEGKLRDIAVDDEGRVWIASNLLTGYDVNASRYQRFGPGQYFTSQFVNCLDVDQDGSIWAGTDDKGLYMVQWESSMILQISMETPLSCTAPQPNAVLAVQVAGGQPPFSYMWSNQQTTDKISNLGPGEYGLTVTDADGIVKSAKYEIPDPSVRLTTEVIKPATTSTPGDGSANVLVDGGTGNMTYAWDNGEKNQLAVALSPGAHSVTVTDESGCSATATVTIPEKVASLAVNIAIEKEIKCPGMYDGALKATVSGGKAPYRFQWNGGSFDEKLTNLSPGDYAVTVADAAGQTATALVKLSAPPAFDATADMTTQAAVSMSNGAAQVKVTGGKSPYSYTWDNQETNAVAKGLSPGAHAVTVTDANGCTTVAKVNITENIATLGVIIKQNSVVSCAGQSTASLMLDISGGKGPYTYAWNNGATTATLDRLPAGAYSVTVTDVVGSKFNATYNVTQPDPLVLTASVDGAASTNTSDGKATVKVSGGTSPYQYAWDNGETVNKALRLPAGNHTVTVTDAAGCSSTASVAIRENILELQVTIEEVASVRCAGSDEGAIQAIAKGGKEPYAYQWSNNVTTPSQANLQDGLYKLTITDASGQSATSVITLNSPPALTVSVRAEAAASTNNADGKAAATVAGGTGKYSFAWSNGETTAKAAALPAGTHTLTVTDENGCSASSTVSISENILPLTVSVRQMDKIRCAGDANAGLAPLVSGGKPPYKYLWKGANLTSTEETWLDRPAGQYAVWVTDANGQSATAAYEVSQPAPLVVTVEEITPSTTGNADGTVTFKVAGGTPGYTIDNTPWPGSGQTYTARQLSPGQYTFVIKDAAGCSTNADVTITENILPLTVSVKQEGEVLCANDASVTLTLNIKGGKPPYTYAWSNGSTSPSISQIGAGNYKANVEDATGLKGQVEYMVKGPAALTVEITNLRSATNDRLRDGKGTAVAKGGVAPYTFTWGSGETTAQASALPLGPGTLSVRDAQGCVVTAEYVIKEKVLPELTAARLSSGEPIRMEKIQFDADSINIKPEAIPSLDELYEFLYDNPTIIIEVSGHTNGLPADDYCDRISSERATSVANYIISKGIEARRVISKGYGKRKPIASNQTPEGRKRNQRVEIRLININE